MTRCMPAGWRAVLTISLIGVLGSGGGVAAQGLLPPSQESSIKTAWWIPSTLGYTGAGFGLSVGALFAINPSLDNGIIVLLPVAGLISGGIFGKKVGSRADNRLRLGQELSSNHRFAIRLGTVLAGTSIGALLAAARINSPGNEGPGRDEGDLTH